MNLVSSNKSVFLIISACLIALALIRPESAFAQVNIESSLNSLHDKTLNIGLILSTISFICGGVLMGYGNPKGSLIVISSAFGVIVMLSAKGIVGLLQSTVG